MELDDYPKIEWSIPARKVAGREIHMPGRDRRSESFLKGLEILDAMEASVVLRDGVLCWTSGNAQGTFVLHNGQEWTVGS